MSSSINPDANPIQNVGNEIQQVINDMKNHQPFEMDLFKARFDLNKLLQDKNLPPEVRKHLQDAMNALSQQNPSEGDLFKAQYDLQQAQTPGK